MKDTARYAKVVEWSEEDQCFVGSCSGLIDGGCHGAVYCGVRVRPDGKLHFGDCVGYGAYACRHRGRPYNQEALGDREVAYPLRAAPNLPDRACSICC